MWLAVSSSGASRSTHRLVEIAMSRKRQHHIIPAFYLGNFTDTGTSTGKLWVLDALSNRIYRAKPSNVGKQRDFYIVRGKHPNALEDEMARIEGSAAASIKRVLKKGIFSNPAELGEVLSFVALVHARTERTRSRLRTSYLDHMRKVLENGGMTSEDWDRLTAEWIEDGVEAGAIPRLEDALSAVREGTFQLRLPEGFTAAVLPDIQAKIFEEISNWRWSLGRATGDAPDFVTSNHPFAVGPDRPNGLGALVHAQGSESATFPLSPRYALIRRNDGRRGTYDAVPEVVGWVNLRTAQNSLGRVFSRRKTFVVWGQTGLERVRYPAAMIRY